MDTAPHYTTAPEDRISLKQKSAYAAGMLVNNLQAAALPAMVVILNLGLGMDPMLVGFLGAIPRIFDAVSDPMLGYISDNTRTRWGRRRPFIFAGALLAGLIFALMWQLPSGYIDFLSGTPAREHQLVAEESSPVEVNDDGKVVVEYDAAKQSDLAIEFFGPKNLTVDSGSAPAVNLNGFPQMEVNVDLPDIQSFRIVFSEAGTSSGGNIGESYYIDLSPEQSAKEEGHLYTFKLSDLKLSSDQKIPTGNQQLDVQSIHSVSILIEGFEGAGEAIITALKLKKGESFFSRYFWYFMGMSILFFLAYTVYATPFVAFGYEMTPDYHERTRLHTFANFFGQLAWLGVPWFYALMASGLFRDTVHGARVLAIGVGIIVAVLGMVPAIFCRERKTIAPKAAEGFVKNMTVFFKGIRTTFRCKPFVKICGATFLVFNGFQLGMSFSLYVMIYYLFNGNDSDAGKLMGWFGMLTSIFTLCVIPLTGWIATRIGKRKTFLITITLSLLGYALKWVGYNPAHPYWLLFATPLVAFGTGSLFTLMGSMISDVCDYDELETHQRREGVFGAIYWWMVKVGMALAGLLTGVLLKVSGFDVALESGQSLKTLFLLRIFDVGIPVVTSAIALLIIAKYTITEERAHEIRTELEHRRGKVAAVQSPAEG